MTERAVRVLHVITSTDRRGAEVAAVTLHRALASHGIGGDVVALGPGRTGGLDVAALGPGGRHPVTIARLRRRIRQADVVLAHGSDTLLAVAVARIGTGTPFVYQLIGDPNVWGAVRLADLRIGAPLRRASTVAALWPAAAEAVTERYRVSPERTAVIGNGRDPEHFRPPTQRERAAARDAIAPGHDGPIIGFIGALSDEKDPLAAIEAAALVEGAKLVVTGDGPLRSAVQARAAAVDAVVTGSVPDTRAVLWALDALLLTSRTEGLPGVVVEAGLCGVGVVAPAVGALPTLIAPEQTAPATAGTATGAAERADAVGRLLADGGEAARRLRAVCLANHTVEVTTRAWVDLLAAIATATTTAADR